MNEVLVYHKGCHLLNLHSVAERERTKCLAVSVANQEIREHVLQKSSINKSKTNAIIFKNQHFSKLKQAKQKKNLIWTPSGREVWVIMFEKEHLHSEERQSSS